MNSNKTAVISLVFALITGSSFGQIMRKGGEYPLVSPESGHQSNPCVALWGDGGMVAWENGSANGYKRIAVQSIGVNGRTSGGFGIVSQNQDKVNDVEPSLHVVNETSAVLVWASGSRANNDIYMLLLGRDGVPMGAVQRVNQTVDRNQCQPSVGVSSDGAIMVVWRSDGQDGDGQGIYGRIYDSSGVPLAEERLINQTTAGNQAYPEVVGMNDTRFLVVWVRGVVDGKNVSGGLKLRSQVVGRFFKGSSAQRNEFGISGVEGVVQSPAVLWDQGNKVRVAWMQREVDSRDVFDIWGVGLDASSGLSEGNRVRINEFTKGEQKNPNIANHGNQFVHIWESAGQDLGGLGVVGRAYPDGVEFVINSQRNLDQYDPAIASDSQGRVVIAWANIIKSDQSIISAQEFSIGMGGANPDAVTSATQTVVSGGGDEVSLPPSAPQLTVSTPVQTQEQTERADNIKKEEVNAPVFPMPPGLSRAASAAARFSSTGKNYSGLREQIPDQNPATVRYQRSNQHASRTTFTPRANLMNSGSAATRAMQNMAEFHRRGMSRDFSSAGIKSSAPAGGRQGYSLSRATLMNPSVTGTRQGNLSTSIRPNSSPTRGSFSQIVRNNGGIAATRGLSSRLQGSRETAKPMDAASRLQMLRGQAQQASSQANLSQREVAAGLVESGGNYAIQWNGQARGRYQVQGSNDKMSWNNYGGVKSRLGSGALSSNVGSGYRYYRVVKSN